MLIIEICQFLGMDPYNAVLRILGLTALPIQNILGGWVDSTWS
jgi:hypothetical protein